MRHRLEISLTLSFALVVSACTTQDRPIDAPKDPKTGIPQLPVVDANNPKVPPTSDKPQVGETGVRKQAVGPALTKAAECDDIYKILRQQAINEVTKRVQDAFDDAWQRNDLGEDGCNNYWGYADCSAMPMADAGAAPPPTGGGDPEDPEHSETNNQVAGVDEADFVKTDGKHVYILSGGFFRVIKSWPAAQTAEVAKVKIDGEPKKLFVHADRALVYSALGQGSSSPYGGYGSNSDCTYGYNCVPTGDGRPTKITVFDISDRTKPKLVRELELSSSLLAARRIGSAVHTVVTMAANDQRWFSTTPENLDVCTATKYELYQAFKKLLADHVATILAEPKNHVLPTVKDTVHGPQGTAVNDSPLLGCKEFYQASIADGEHFTSVVSVAIDDEQPAQAATIFSRPGVVYASQDALYLAVPRQRHDDYGWYQDMAASEATAVHKFRLSSALASSRYVASGVIEGRLLNQFSLDEHQGHLRLASTTGHLGSSHNSLTVLQEQGTALAEVGKLSQLAPTEDIRSVRFDGEKGYVVTFKKTDPLFVLDLADPTQPKVFGELKIPGFSTYMHKMDDDHLLTIGYDADDQGSFAWFTGVALQVFDVSDPLNPKQKFKHVIGTRGSSSEALTNHLAFTYYAPKNLLALPMTVCEGASGGGSYGDTMTFSGLMLFDVTAQSGFAAKAQIPHPVGPSATCSNWWTDASSQVKRSLIIDNYVFSISETLMKVNDLSNAAIELAQVSLQ